MFETPMELHCSQTTELLTPVDGRLRPLWNYTALKPLHPLTYQQNRLRPLWNYTALKRSLIDIVVNLV